jgi:hypothetical protein
VSAAGDHARRGHAVVSGNRFSVEASRMRTNMNLKISTSIAAMAVLGAQASAQTHYVAQPHAGPLPQTVTSNTVSLAWNTIESGAGVLSGGVFSLISTTGQFEAGNMAAGPLSLEGGFWPGLENPAPCYANCDSSVGLPRLTAGDLACFINRFAAADAYANCDGSTTAPVLNIMDYQCFLLKFAAGCP